MELKKEMLDVYNRLKKGEFNRDIGKQIYKFCKKVREYNDPELKKLLLEGIIKELSKILDERGETKVINISGLQEGEIVKVSDGLYIRKKREGFTIIQISTEKASWEEVIKSFFEKLKKCDKKTQEELMNLSKEEMDKLIEMTYDLFPDADICPVVRTILALNLWLDY